MSPSRSIILGLLISTLVTLCYAANNNSSGKTKPSMRQQKIQDQGLQKGQQNEGSQQFPPYGPCGYGACFCAPGIPGMPGNPGPYGPQGIAGSPGPQGSTGPRGDKGDAGKPGKQGPLGPKGPPGALVLKGGTGPVGPRGAKGDAGDKGSQGPPGLQGSPGTLGGNWKQCVFSNLNDGKDTGLIKDCVFRKNADNTSLRVFWSGTLRIYNCHSCCRRWYFTFNGAECSAPAAIDGVVYMVHGNGAKKNLHRVRQIEGVCENVHKGTVRVGFWVGNCANYGSADASTGWNSVSRIYVEEVPPPQA